MNLAPGKSDFRFEWSFVQKHRCYVEIITGDGSHAFNKWPWWKLLSKGRILSPAVLFPFGLSQLHLLGLSLYPPSLSSYLWTSFRLFVPLANYSICWLQNYFTQFPACSWCANITKYFWCLSPCSRMTTHTLLQVTLLCWKELQPFLPLTLLLLIGLQIGLGGALT